jgi:hypothetical protein
MHRAIIITFGQLQINKFLKKAVTCLLMLLVSFAYSYETIAYFSNTEQTSVCEQSGPESEDHTQKTGNETFADDDFYSDRYLQYKLVSDHVELGALAFVHLNVFSSSDYSNEVYSPPELLV